MKTITLNTFVLSLIVGLLISIDFAYAQSPQKFSYQAVIRNESDELVASQNIGIQISILKNSESGTAVYVEQHFPTTNTNGLVSLEIGTGTVVSGDFESIAWGGDSYFIETETDLDGGSNYSISGTSQLLSVPYALFAGDVKKAQDGLLVTGEFGQGADLATSGAGTKLFFYPKKAAFRAGTVNSSQWDEAQIGDYSSAWGLNTVASGFNSTAWGQNTEASGFRSTVWGQNTEASGSTSTAWGQNTVASESTSTAWGDNTVASGTTTTAWGYNTVASAFYSTAWGRDTEASGYNSTAWGNNTVALGTRSIAWGFNTVASGSTSTAWGNTTEASGSGSTAWGSDTEASGFRSTAWGLNTEASGLSSTVWGDETVASGFNSTAWGDKTVASGFNSTVWGDRTVASGNYSTAWGSSTVAKSRFETALGRYNTDYTPLNTFNWNVNDRLFGIGNGTSSNDKSDAMVVLKNGNTGIGISNPQHKLAVEVTTNTTPNGDGIGLVNTNNDNFWNIHMSQSFLRFSYNNAVATAYIQSDGTYVQPSDRRLKENIQPLQDGVLQKVNNINTVHYNYTNDKEKNTLIGVIAQELKELFPEFVSEDDVDNYMGVNYAGLSIVAIKAIQEQQTEIEELKARNKALEDKMNQIIKRLE